MGSLIAISRESYDLVLDIHKDLPEDEQVVFACSPLTSRQRAKALDLLVTQGTSGVNFATGSQLLHAFRCSVTKLTPPLKTHPSEEHPDGEPIPVERSGGVISDGYLDRVPLDVVQEIGRKILDQTQLTDEQAGE